MRAGIVVNVTRADRHRLEAIVSDRSAPQHASVRSRISLSHILRDCDQFRIPLRIASKLASDKTVRPYAKPVAAIGERRNYPQSSLTNLSLDDVLDPSVYYGHAPSKGIEITKIGRHVDDCHFNDHRCIDVSRDVVEYDGSF